MKYEIMGGHFDLEEHGLTIRDFEDAKDNRERERLFIPIAERILASEHFQQVNRPDKSQSVPFDFIATRDQKLALIEMKAAEDDSNYSSVVQFARLLGVSKKLEEKKTTPSLFLLQINLKYRVYQILTQQFYELVFRGAKEIIEKKPEIGRKQTIKPSLKAIEDYRDKYNKL